MLKEPKALLSESNLAPYSLVTCKENILLNAGMQKPGAKVQDNDANVADQQKTKAESEK